MGNNNTVMHMKRESYWLNEKKNFDFEIKENINTDVLIIGGGMSGIMTAYELSKDTNINITVVDAGKLARNISAKTSAKITPLHNLMYQDIEKIHGLNKAKNYYNSQVEAMNYIVDTIQTENIDCDLTKENNYMFSETDSGTTKLTKEIDTLSRMKVKFSTVDKLPIDIKIKKAIKYEGNYLFHPIKYLNKIIEIISKRKNVTILENYKAINYKKGDNNYYIYFDNDKVIKSKYVVVSTHYPIFNLIGLYPGKLYQEKSYLLAFKSDKKINGMYINTEKPVKSLRYNNNTIILVGNSHTAGQKVNYKQKTDSLIKEAKKIDKNAKITNVWTNQDVMSIDYLPFIGQYSRFTPNMFVQTAFHTWGMTNSHVAALLVSREILNKKNPFKYLYNPLRFSHINSIVESIKIIGKSINGLIISRITTNSSELDKIKKNEGAIVNYKGVCYGAYNNGDEYLLVKPNCTHTHCFMQWNSDEKTWDCKCHGSRFDIYGKVIEGPAIKNLKLVKIKKEDLDK